MVNIQEIRSQIGSIQSIKKIAKVMEMVALSKMTKTQQRMLDSRPYADMVRKVVTHISLGNLEYKHPYLISRHKICRVGYLVISTDRGLIGSLNINVFKKVLDDINRWHSEGIGVKLFLIGAKAVSFFSFIKENIVTRVVGLGDNPSLSELIGPIKSIIQLYDTFYVDKIYIVFNKFKNILLQVPCVFQVLPLLPFHEEEKSFKKNFWDYLYEPDAKVLLDALLLRYIELQVYQGVVENIASEQAARMVAMKSASDNAESVIKELKLVYNKVRQTKITQELIEIISGSTAIG